MEEGRWGLLIGLGEGAKEQGIVGNYHGDAISGEAPFLGGGRGSGRQRDTGGGADRRGPLVCGRREKNEKVRGLRLGLRCAEEEWAQPIREGERGSGAAF